VKITQGITILMTAGCGDFFNPQETPRVQAMDVAHNSHDATNGETGVSENTVFHGCMPENFVDRSAPGAARTLTFGGAMFAFDPKCMTIAAGQTVTFTGNFSFHPLSRGINPTPEGLAAGTPGNPIPTTTSGNTISVSFPRAGTFPYFCALHLSNGMAGVIVVRP
jgi:plastocyanin